MELRIFSPMCQCGHPLGEHNHSGSNSMCLTEKANCLCLKFREV